MKKIKFDLSSNEVIIKVKYVQAKEGFDMNKLYVYKMLNVLNYEGLLPRGYLTRVNNSNIGYEACLKMVQKLAQQSRYRIASKSQGSRYIIVLIEKEIEEIRYEVYLKEPNGIETLVVDFKSLDKANAYINNIYNLDIDSKIQLTIRDNFSGDLIAS